MMNLRGQVPSSRCRKIEGTDCPTSRIFLNNLLSSLFFIGICYPIPHLTIQENTIYEKRLPEYFSHMKIIFSKEYFFKYISNLFNSSQSFFHSCRNILIIFPIITDDITKIFLFITVLNCMISFIIPA